MDMKEKTLIWYKQFLTDKYLFYITVISIIFSGLFIAYSFMDYNLVNMSAWDMGVYTQALSSEITGHLFYSNLIPGSYLSEHFSPFLFILIIPYYFAPSGYTLLFLQDAAIGMSTVILFLVAREIFKRTKFNGKYINKNSLPFIISFAYLLSPLTESPVFFDFHLMVFLPLFFFLAIYFYLKQKYLLNIIFLAMIVSLHSSFIFIVLMTVIMELFLNNTLKIKNVSYKKYSLLLGITFIVLAAYYMVAGLLKGEISGSLSIFPHIHVTGSVSPISLPVYIITKPLYVFNLLSSYYYLKLIILFFAFGAFAFLFLRYPPAIFTFIPYLLYSMFSTYQSYYTIGYQYTMMIIPMAAFAAVMGLYMMDKNRHKIKSYNKKITVAVIAIIIVGILGFSIASPVVYAYKLNNTISSEILEYSNSSAMAKINFEHEISKNIGKDALVVTENGLFSLFANDPNATAFPFTGSVIIHGYYYTYLVDDENSNWSKENASINDKCYSLNDLETKYTNSGLYGVYADNYGIIVLKKGYTGPVNFN
jgi:uncharacterized membrane protein